MGCAIWAEQPNLESAAPGEGTLSGTGHRECDGSDTEVAKVTVRLRAIRSWWPDRTLDSESERGTTVHLTARYDCQGTGHQRVFTEIIVDEGRRWIFFRRTRKARSPDIAAPYCG